MQQKPQDAYMVTVIKEPAKQTTIADVIIGSLGITGILLLSSMVLGALFAAILVRWHRAFPPQLGHLPPVSPLVPDPHDQQSSQVQ